MKTRKITAEEKAKHPNADYVIELGYGNQYFTAKALKELQVSLNELLPSPPSLPTAGAKEFLKKEFPSTKDSQWGYDTGLTLNEVEELLNSFAHQPPQVNEYVPTNEEIMDRAMRKKFYPDCNRGEAWAEGYFACIKDFPPNSAPTTIGITDAEIKEMFPQNRNATYEDEVRDNLNQTQRIVGATIMRDKLSGQHKGKESKTESICECGGSKHPESEQCNTCISDQ